MFVGIALGKIMAIAHPTVVIGTSGLSSKCGSEFFSEIFLKKFLIIFLVFEKFLVYFLNLLRREL